MRKYIDFNKGKHQVIFHDPKTKERVYLGRYDSEQEAFEEYCKHEYEYYKQNKDLLPKAIIVKDNRFIFSTYKKTGGILKTMQISRHLCLQDAIDGKFDFIKQFLE